MKRLYKFLTALVITMTGGLVSQAETVANYTIDFNSAISTSNHDFRVASNWKHIVDKFEDSYGDVYYMTYTYKSSDGVEGTGALYCGEQKAGDYWSGEEQAVWDLLVTPVVNGKIYLKVKGYSSYGGYVELYKVNATGTAKDGSSLKKIAQNTDFTNSDYSEIEVDLAELGLDGQRVGIRASKVYLDDFRAESAEIELEKSIKIVTAEPSATSGVIYWDQQANGKVLVKYMVTVRNNGEVALTSGDENYSISLIAGTGSKAKVIGTVPVPVNLAIGDTSEPFAVTAEVEPSTVWAGSYSYVPVNLMENLQGSLVTRANSNYKPWEAKFVFRKANSSQTSVYTDPVAMGMVTAATTMNYEIFNNGIAPLTIKSISLPQGFTMNLDGSEFVLGKEETKPFDITFPATKAGKFAGNLVIEYSENGGEVKTFTLPVSATMIAEGTWFADFNSDNKFAYPAGTVAEGGVQNAYKYVNGGYNYWLKSYTNSEYAEGNNKFITPKLHAAADDVMSFDVASDDSSKEDTHFLKVYLSKDRMNWGEPVATYLETELEGTNEWNAKSISFPEEGDWYVGFAIYGVRLDNLVGGTKVDVTNDLFIKSVSQKDEVQSGVSYDASVDVIAVSDIAKETYTVKYYVDGVAVADLTARAMTASATSTTTFKTTCSITADQTKTVPTYFKFVFDDGTSYRTADKYIKVTNEPYFVFFDKDTYVGGYAPDSRKTAIDFGKVNATGIAKEFEIYNWGTAPLQVKSISVPGGFSVSAEAPLTVEGKARQQVDVTFSAETAGVYGGDLEIVYVDNEGADATFKLAVSGTMLDTGKWYATFDDGSDEAAWPKGSIRGKNVSAYNGGTWSSPNFYINSSSTEYNMFITPKLHAEAGEALQFDAMLYSKWSTDGAVKVYAAATREGLSDESARKLLVTVAGDSEDESLKPVLDKFTTFNAVMDEAGDYYIGFEITGSLKVDELYGFSLVPVAHEWMNVTASVPETGMQNNEVKGSLKVLNIGLVDEKAGDYTVKVTVNGKEFASQPEVTIYSRNLIDDEARTTVPFSFRSSKVGKFSVNVEISAGDYTIAAEPVEITITEEIINGEKVVGDSKGTSSIFNNLNYNHSESVQLYTADDLGLAAGAKIKSIRFKGTGTSGDLVTAVKVYYELTDDTEEVKPTAVNYDTTNMTCILDNENYEWKKSSTLTDLLVINLENPIVYEAGKSLRIFVKSDANKYKSFSFEAFSKKGNAYRQHNDYTLNGSWGDIMERPVMYLDLAIEPRALSGTVTDPDGNAVEGAVVILTSNDGDDVEYEATSGADGAYNVNVIQSSRTYDAMVTAEGMEAGEEGINVADESLVKNFQLSHVFVISEEGANLFDATNAVVYLKPMLKDGLNAVALPFSLTKDEVYSIFGANADVYTFQGVKAASGVVQAYFPSVMHADTTVPEVAPEAQAEAEVAMEAGVPYLVYIDEEMQPQKFNADVKAEMKKTVTENMDFVATAAEVEPADNQLVLDGTQFAKAAEGVKVLPFQAYLHAKNSDIAGAAVNLHSMPDAVEGIVIDREGDDVIYDLNGFRVKNPDKGIYIINGKAVMVK